MKIMHRISFNTHRHPAFLSRLQEIGLKYTDIKLPGKGGNLIECLLISFENSKSTLRFWSPFKIDFRSLEM